MPVQTPLPSKYLKNNDANVAIDREHSGNSWSFHCRNIAAAFPASAIPFNRRRGFVYFATDCDLIKIGHSIHPKQRVANQRSPHGNQPKLIAHFPGFMDEEHGLHRLFSDRAAYGDEWLWCCAEIDDFITVLHAHREPLFKRRITISDIVFGRHTAILEMPVVTKEIHIPAQADEFSRWADRECPKWPTDLMVKSAHAAAAMKKQYGTDPSHIDRFADAYRKWSGV